MIRYLNHDFCFDFNSNVLFGMWVLNVLALPVTAKLYWLLYFYGSFLRDIDDL